MNLKNGLSNICNNRNTGQIHIPQAPTLLDNAAYNE